jgi:hypothetical protein
VDRAELGALRDAIDTILSWPDPVRDQIAQWLQTDASKPNGAGRDRSSRSRSNRPSGFKPSVGESAAREQALLAGYARRSGGWRRAVGEDNPLRQERGLHAARPIGQARPRRAGRQRSLVARRGKPYDAAVTLTAEEEAELLAPVAVACPPWLTPIAASTSRDVLLRIQRVQFREMRGAISVARFG